MKNVLDHPVIRELQKHHIPMQIQGREVWVEGFGKASYLKLRTSQGVTETYLIGASRYEREVRIENFDDVVKEAWYWYGVTAPRMGGEDEYPAPTEWRRHFIEAAYMGRDGKPLKRKGR